MRLGKLSDMRETKLFSQDFIFIFLFLALRFSVLRPDILFNLLIYVLKHVTLKVGWSLVIHRLQWCIGLRITKIKVTCSIWSVRHKLTVDLLF